MEPLRSALSLRVNTQTGEAVGSVKVATPHTLRGTTLILNLPGAPTERVRPGQKCPDTGQPCFDFQMTTPSHIHQAW
jgi:hypothetical protein